MRVSGFTFVRNAVRLDFPVVECIKSVLPLVDEFIVVVGDSDDGTDELIRLIGDPRIVIIPSRWNPNVRGGFVLAQQTNIALMNCTGKWAVYIQADEAIHDDDHAHLRHLMEKYQDDDKVESLSLHRTNFLGDYETCVSTFDDLCVRIVKPHRFVLSRSDAAGFTVHPKYKERGRRISTIDTGIRLFHYFDLRLGRNIAAKRHAELVIMQGMKSAPLPSVDEQQYYTTYPRSYLWRFEGTHPAPMRERRAQHMFKMDHDSPILRTKLTMRERKLVLREFLARYVSRQWFRMGARSSRIVGAEGPVPSRLAVPRGLPSDG